MIKIEEILKKYKIVIILVIGVIAIFLIKHIYFDDSSSIEISQENTSNVTASQSDEEEELIYVHVSGAVANPGVISLKEGLRINDAIELAGGLLPNANIDNINLAQKLEDGTKLYIPNTQEIEQTDSTSENSLSSVNTYYLNQDINSSSKLSTQTQTSTKININKATKEELMTLNGIGEATAQKIISYREANGKFEEIEDIKNVNGIGDAKFENIKDDICTN